MSDQERSAGPSSGPNPPQEGVVRLPVTESDISDQLETMPAPAQQGRLQPASGVDLMEEAGEDPIELSPADLGVGWEAEEAERRQTPIGWLVLIGVILLGLGGWALGKLSKGEAHLDEQVELVQANWDEEERKRQEALDFLSRVERVTRDYLGAGDLSEKAKHVRHAKRVIPLMDAYYRRHDFKPLQFERIDYIRPIAIEQRPFVFLTVGVEGGETIMLFIEDTPEGELKFDWEAEVAYQPVELEDYVEQKPTEPMDFRVYARLDTFYSYEFSDQGRYQALLLTARDSGEFLFGYMERGTEDELELTAYLKREVKRRKPMMLRLRFLPGTLGKRSVLVEKVLARSWVHVEPPVDEKALPAPQNL